MIIIHKRQTFKDITMNDRQHPNVQNNMSVSNSVSRLMVQSQRNIS